jgi:hypothetical protein
MKNSDINGIAWRRLFVVVFLGVAASLPAIAEERVKIDIYRLPAEVACGPNGYQPKKQCPVKWNYDTFKKFRSRMSLLKGKCLCASAADRIHEKTNVGNSPLLRRGGHGAVVKT